MKGDALMSYEGGRNVQAAAAAAAGPPAWGPTAGDTTAAAAAAAAVQRFPFLPRKASDAPRTPLQTRAGGGTLMGMSGLVLSPIDDSQCSP